MSVSGRVNTFSKDLRDYQSFATIMLVNEAYMIVDIIYATVNDNM